MSSSPAVQISATYPLGRTDEPLVSVLERNLDRRQVIIERHPAAVRALFINFVIDVATKYAFTKFVLEPLAGPFAEKWIAAVKGRLHPQSFKLIVRLNGNGWIEVPPEADLKMTAEIWNTIISACNVLKAEGRWDDVSKIRFTPDKDGRELVVCYENNRPTRLVIVSESKTVEIPADQTSGFDRPT